MTLEETAKIFSEKWNKDINRTHIASAKRMAQNLFNNEMLMLESSQNKVLNENLQTNNLGKHVYLTARKFSEFTQKVV